MRYPVVGVYRLREGFVYTHYVNLLQVSSPMTSLWTLTFQFEFIAMLSWASNAYISILNICFANQNHNLFMSSLFFWFESSYFLPHYAEILTIYFIKIHLPLFKFLSIYVWHFYDYFPKSSLVKQVIGVIFCLFYILFQKYTCTCLSTYTHADTHTPAYRNTLQIFTTSFSQWFQISMSSSLPDYFYFLRLDYLFKLPIISLRFLEFLLLKYIPIMDKYL